MAYTVPETIRSSATTGEQLLFRTLKTYLPDDYIVYYEPEIQGRRPDFVIVGPDLGLVVLEVKDYTKNTLYQLNVDEWTIRNTAGQLHKVASPLRQARQYVYHIADQLKQDKNLIQLDGKYRFQLKFPYGYGTVFTLLYQKDFVQEGLYQIIEPNYVLTRDEIDPEKELFSEEYLVEKIMNMFVVPYRLREPLTNEEIASIRYHLFPEVRISAEFKPAVPYQDKILLSLHDIKIMDLHQENMAKQLGDKHRLIRGVAGSGKNLILASRAKLLIDQNPEWKILILCYNITLAQNIKKMIRYMMSQPDTLFDFSMDGKLPDVSSKLDNIFIRNFHEWLKLDLRIHEQQIPSIIEKVEQGEAILPKYDAILIDEGQDFFQKHSKLKTKVVQGEFEGMEIIPPQSTKRRGTEPAIIKSNNFWEEMRIVARQMKKLHEREKVFYSQESEYTAYFEEKKKEREQTMSILTNSLEMGH